MVVIYKGMYTNDCENTLRIEAIEGINNESLNRLRCMCTSELHKFYNFTLFLYKDILSAILGVQI